LCALGPNVVEEVSLHTDGKVNGFFLACKLTLWYDFCTLIEQGCDGALI
jgi:hypothetical protein